MKRSYVGNDWKSSDNIRKIETGFQKSFNDYFEGWLIDLICKMLSPKPGNRPTLESIEETLKAKIGDVSKVNVDFEQPYATKLKEKK